MPAPSRAGNSVARSAVARAASFLPTAAATLVTSRLVIGHYGLAAFDSFALMLALINLLPLNNVGVGAAVTSAYAGQGPTSAHAFRVTVTAARTLLVSTVVTAVVSLVLGAAGSWSRLLGAASGPSGWIGLAMAVYALSFLPGLAQSMLLGVERNHVTVVVQTFFTPTILAGAILLTLTSAPAGALVLLPPAALLLNNLALCVVAARTTSLRWGPVLRAVPFRRRHPGARIRTLSGPVLITTVVTPIALQSDRIVLSHVSTQEAVAAYSVLLQIIAPALALIAATAQPLWPIYERARSEGRRGPHLGRVVLAFCAAAAVAGAAVVAVSGPLASVIGRGQIDLGILLPVAGALSIVTTAASYPVAMHLMDVQGARVVAALSLLALPLNLGLSILLAERLGAPGPLLATVAVGVAIQTVPALLYARGRYPVGRHRLVTTSPARAGIPPLFDAPGTPLEGSLRP